MQLLLLLLATLSFLLVSKKPRLALLILSLTPFHPALAQPWTDADLSKVRDDFTTRRQTWLAPLAGKPFRPAKKNPPLAPGRPEYVRGYAWSVTDFAMKTFLLGETPEPANGALIDLFQYFARNRDVRNDADNFYWSMDVVCRLIEFYGRGGSRQSGLLSIGAEEAALEMMWLWARENSRVADAEWEVSKTWWVWGSENHHLQRWTTAWHFSKLLMQAPAYCERAFDDGKTAAQHAAAWTAYARTYLLERARKSLFVEIASDGYNSESLKGIYNLFDFAPDPELKRRAGLFLDLYWALWAEEQLDGVRGGGKSRIYPGLSSIHGLAGTIAHWGWIYFGLGTPPAAPQGPDYTILTSGWRPSLVVLDLALDAAGRGIYETRQWPLGLAVPGFEKPPEYRLRTTEGGILRYSYCTPDFIMGTLMFAARPRKDWTDISSQNRWQGVIFSGSPEARIFPQVRALQRNRTYNQHWSVQRKGTLITQKLKTSAGAGEMRVWFGQPLLGGRVEKDGWVFAEAPGAYAAVRPAAGSWRWQTDDTYKSGQWMVPDDTWAPVIIEVTRKSEVSNYQEFQRRVAALASKYRGGLLEYTNREGCAFTFYADASQPPRINGAAVDFAVQASFASPFIQSARESGVVQIKKGQRALQLDFNQR